ncbi:HNH endonuclease signature motif containing protein [Agromyces humi]|uniref:HNH endonuclease signature motif containing protein n=1 Tax=Agromyces humi TaxID=1766800 RepID=UPI00135CD000|nr:HNH endonuclease signature motif containing protein [Agromyces humi]
MNPSLGLDARARLHAELDLIVELERAVRAAKAEQLRRIEVARRLAAEVEGVTDSSSFADREFATRSFVAELATALVVHEATAGRLIADARHLCGAFAATLDALSAGTICVPQVRSLIDVASGLPAAHVGAFETAALTSTAPETPSAFRRRIRRLRERMHPEPSDARHERARDERRVVLEPADDGMSWLSMHLEAERGVAIMAHLDALVDAVPDQGDDARNRRQRLVDTAGDLLLGRAVGAAIGTTGAMGTTGTTRTEASPLGVVRPRVYVTVPVLTLLGLSDEPAELDGHGPIPAETARRLAAHAPSFHRILTHPETGAYLSYGRTRYRVPADLAGYLRVRDGACRFPGCSRRAAGCDVDHTRDWAAGGATRHDNLAHLCRKHHRLKHHSGWRMSQMPGGDIRWTSPAGRAHVSSPDRRFLPPDALEPSALQRNSASLSVGPPSSPSDDPEPPWAARRGEASAAGAVPAV